MNFLSHLAFLVETLSVFALPAESAVPGEFEFYPAVVPDGLSDSDWNAIRDVHNNARHAFALREDGCWLAHNPGQRWTTISDRRGFLVRPDRGAWTWGLELRSFGFGDIPTVVADLPTVVVEGPRLTYRWSAELDEWFVNDQRGLEHGFTLHERPLGSPQSVDGSLSFLLARRGPLCPVVNADRTSVSFVDASGVVELRYSRLKVWDADGMVLESSFEVEGEEGIRLLVDERGAKYPITIDPVAQQGCLKASNAEADDQFGTAVAVSGDTVVVGAPLEDGTGDRSGAAYVFVQEDGAWSQKAILRGSDTDEFDRFGQSVGISGGTIVVGAPFQGGIPAQALAGEGAAYVFVGGGAIWQQQGRLKPALAEHSDKFGTSVAVSGDLVVVGAPAEDSNGTHQGNNDALEAGAAYVYARDGGGWTAQTYLKASNVGTGDAFGLSVAISGATIVVGAPSEGEGAGGAYVFVRGPDGWAQEKYLKASNANGGDNFGNSVGISGDSVIIGAPFEDSNAIGVDGNQTDNSSASAGAAYVFTRSGGTWPQQAYLKASNTGTIDVFGHSVAISGDRVLVGASFEDGFAGAAYLFIRSANKWMPPVYLKASNAAANSWFGRAVAISGSTVVVGAERQGGSAGGAYVYFESGSGPAPDEDGDGIPDFAEMYFGTSPSEPNGEPFTVTYTATETTLGWPVADPTGVRVTPQWSPDNRTWLASGEPAPGFGARTLIVSTSEEGQSQVVVSSVGLSSAFLRIVLERP
ncbi:MAG: FG-GAP repeat protein [Verrucomicrobiae bacterium]|nr:FG-GAP repeat protein [Verrucomicrobiae bacterium]